MPKLFLLKSFFLSAILTLLLLTTVKASDQVHTAASLDGSPFGFNVINPPIINSNSLTINSPLSNNFVGLLDNPWGWNHNFATYVYGETGAGSSSSFTNNSSITNYSQINNDTNHTNPNFINTGVWSGYNWNNPSETSIINNNGSSTNTLEILNQDRGNFYNYNLYSANVDYSYINNLNYIQNTVTIQNSNGIGNLYNFSISSFDTKIQDVFQNEGTILNQINIQNSTLTTGLFNYSLHSFFLTNNNLQITYDNQGIIQNTCQLTNTNVGVQIRNQAIAIVPNNPTNTNNINVTNSSLILSTLVLTNSNTSFLSNDGIAVHNSNIANITNTGQIEISTSFDNTFNGIVNSIAGIFLSNVSSGSVTNNGLIRVTGTTQNNFSAAGIHLFNSGTINPIQITTPELMILDNNVRNIIINQSNAELLSFGFYVNGDPTSNNYLRPILNFNNSNLNLNNTTLHLYIGNEIHLNKPYYIVENQAGSNVTGQFNPTFVNHTPISNPNIKIGWFNNSGQNSSIIFTIDPKFSLQNVTKQNIFIASKNINDLIRNDIIMYNTLDKNPNLENNKLQIRSFNFYEKLNSDDFDSSILGKSFIIDKYLNNNLKAGLILGGGTIETQSKPKPQFIPLDLKISFNSIGAYLNYQNANSYVLATANHYNLRHKETSFTGLNLDIPSQAKYNSYFTHIRVEYGFKNNFNIGMENINTSKINYTTQTATPLWQTTVSSKKQNIAEIYLSYDHHSKDEESFYYSNLKVSYTLNGNKLITNEIIQNQEYQFEKKLSKFTVEGVMYFKPLKNPNLHLGLLGEYNKDYYKYALILRTRL